MISDILTVACAVALVLLFGGMIARRSLAPQIIYASLALHGLVAVVVYLLDGLAVPDARLYDETGQAYAMFWSGDSPVAPTFSVGKDAWPIILGGLYHTFGHLPILGILLNVLACVAATSLMIAGSLLLTRSQRVARVAGWLSLLPTFVYWPSFLVREAFVYLCTALIFWATCRLITDRWRAGIVWFLAGVGAMLWVRGTIAIPLAVLAFVAVLIASGGFSMRKTAIAFIAAIGTVPFWGQVGNLIAANDLAKVDRSRTALSQAGSGFDVGASYSSPLDVIRSLPSTLSRALFGPYPWELGGLPATAVVDLVLWLFIVGLVLIGVSRSALPLRLAAISLVPALGLLAVLGVASGNYGTLIRIRAQVALILLPVAAAGFVSLRKRVHKHRVVGIGSRSDSALP